MQGAPISDVFSHHHEPSRNKYSSSKFWNSCHWNIYTIKLSLNLLKFISNNIAILEALIAGTKHYIIIQLLFRFNFSLSIKTEFIISLSRSNQSVKCFHFYEIFFNLKSNIFPLKLSLCWCLLRWWYWDWLGVLCVDINNTNIVILGSSLGHGIIPDYRVADWRYSQYSDRALFSTSLRRPNNLGPERWKKMTWNRKAIVSFVKQ